MPRKQVTPQEVHDEGIDGMLKYLRKFKASDPAGNASYPSDCPVQHYYAARLPGRMVRVYTSSICIWGQIGVQQYDEIPVQCLWENHVQREFNYHQEDNLTVGQVRRDLRAVKRLMEVNSAP